MTNPAGKHKGATCEHEISESAAGPSFNKAPSVRRGSSNSQRNHVHMPVSKNDEQAEKPSPMAKERSNVERRRRPNSSLDRQEEELKRLLGVV